MNLEGNTALSPACTSQGCPAAAGGQRFGQHVGLFEASAAFYERCSERQEGSC